MASSYSSGTPTVVFAGVGALGTLFAAALTSHGQRAGHEGEADAFSQQCHALSWDGRPSLAVTRQLISQSLELSEISTDITLAGITLADLAALEPGWLLITAKSSAAMALLDLLFSQTEPEINSGNNSPTPFTLRGWTLVLMQNGLSCHSRARELVAGLPADSAPALLAATTTEAARRLPDSPSTVIHSAPGKTRIGYLLDSPGARRQARLLAATLCTAGMESLCMDDIEPALWHKLAVNCVINPLSALAGCTNGDLLATVEFNQTATAICEEIRAAWLMEIGSAPSIDELVASVTAICVATAANRSSMLQDVTAGRQTEIEAINGFIVSCCRKHGLPCDVNRSLLLRVSALYAQIADVHFTQDQ